jgi:hypothetical protein
MPEPTYPATINTLGKLVDHGMGAFMLCPTCQKAGRPDVRDVDLERLAGRVGRDWYFINQTAAGRSGVPPVANERWRCGSQCRRHPIRA